MGSVHKRSVRKGKTHERAVARRLREILPNVQRVPQNEAGHGKPDIYAPGWHVECKHRLCPNVRRALEQAVNDAEQDGRSLTPVAVVRFDDGPGRHGTELVAMRFEDWLELVREHYERGQL